MRVPPAAPLLSAAGFHPAGSTESGGDVVRSRRRQKLGGGGSPCCLLGGPPKPSRGRSPMGTKGKGLPEALAPVPGAGGGQGDAPVAPGGVWGGPHGTVAVLGVCCLVPRGTWGAGGCPHPRSLQGCAVTAQGPLGACKSQKIKFFPAKSVGRASWGPVVPERSLGTAAVWRSGGGGWRGSSLDEETEAREGATLWLGGAPVPQFPHLAAGSRNRGCVGHPGGVWDIAGGLWDSQQGRGMP